MALGPPPDPFPKFNTRKIPKGLALVRVHDPAFDGAAGNPCRGGQTRFAPLTLPNGDCLPTLYAADDFECAVFESIFHDIAHDAAKKYVALPKITSRAVSWLTTAVPLTVAGLNEPDLMRLDMTRADLVAGPPAGYAVTARWAEAFHRANSGVCGLAWTSRRCDPSQAYVFYADRLPADALKVTRRVELSSSAPLVSQIRAFGKRAGITITL